MKKRSSLILRLWTYQRERFPVLPTAIMVTAFTFSAISFSRLSRGINTFIPIHYFIIGAFTSFGFFFLLRAFDEFKDAEEDAKYRSYRPVPRGLVSLREIGLTAAAVIIIQFTLNFIFMPVMLLPFFLVMVYMYFMTKEFFISKWLKEHPIVYMTTHMFIMPLIDFYTTGLDWANNYILPAHPLILFLLVTFLNGIVIEFGRKIRAPEAEETGVDTYSKIYGSILAPYIWIIILFVTMITAALACYSAGFSIIEYLVLFCFFIICSFPAFRFIKTQQQKHALQIEKAAGIWTITMYLSLGGIPMLINLIKC